MKIKLKMLLYLLFSFIGISAFGQDSSLTEINQRAVSEKSGNTHFLLTGYGFAGFEKIGEENSTFGPAGFAPIFLWQKSNKLFIEAEAEFVIKDGELDIGLEYATLHYRLGNYLSFGAGKFLSPFGIFGERLHPAWINKFAEKPLGFSHDAGAMIGPMSELGIELRGGAQLGSSKINYVAYVTNGPQLNTGADDPMMAGILEFGELGDNNNNKAVGARIGWLPLANSSLELGISGQTAKVGEKGSSFEKVSAGLIAYDLSFIQKIEPLQSNLDLKFQLNTSYVSSAKYMRPDSSLYSFSNNSSTWFAQLAIRPAFVDNNFFRNVELAAQYSAVKTPSAAKWATDLSKLTIGLNYWLDWNSVIKINFQRVHDKMTGDNENGFLIQWGMGF